MNKKEIITSRLVLRNIKSDDIDDFLYYRSNKEVAKYQTWFPYTKEQALDTIKKYNQDTIGKPGEWTMYGISLNDHNKIIGDCSFKADNHESRNYEIGCSVSQDYQCKGYAKEAILALFDFIFNQLNGHRITGITDTKNISSINLLESLKMRKEAHFIKNIFFKGAWGDEYNYAILREEYRKWFIR